MIAVEIHREGVGAAQNHMAGIGLNNSVVDHLGRRQHHRAAAGCLDRAVVDDRVAPAAEVVAAFVEILVGQVRGCGQQSTDIDAGIGAEQHTIGIEQPDLAIGADRAVNGGEIGAGDPVEGDGAGIGLVELDRGARAYREILPVDDGLGRRLVDGGGGARGQHLRLARNHRCANRLGKGPAHAHHQEGNDADRAKRLATNTPPAGTTITRSVSHLIQSTGPVPPVRSLPRHHTSLTGAAFHAMFPDDRTVGLYHFRTKYFRQG